MLVRICVRLALVLGLGSYPGQLLAETWSFGAYSVESFYEPGGDNGYRILKDGKELYSASPGGFRIISVSGGRQTDEAKPAVNDITGDRVPDLIIEEFPVHQSCCFSYTIFSLGTKFQLLSHLTGFRSPMTFQSVNRDGVYEITGEDWTFTSWYACPQIILRYDGRGGYRLATNLMRRPPPTPATLSQKAAQFRGAAKLVGFAVPPVAYEFMLDLTYSGNLQSVWDLVNLLWRNPKSPERTSFREEFLTQLRKSPYWSEIRAMNGTP